MNDWIDRLDEAISFVEDLDSRSLILLRFEDQYEPALRQGRNPQDIWRAWEAFRYYLTTRRTRRKPFQLTESEADRIISIAIEMLDLPPHIAPV